jgi:gamma-glutamylcyclotransferase (GGCT)/AIG2-like uncharacterized protein YtfP
MKKDILFVLVLFICAALPAETTDVGQVKRKRGPALIFTYQDGGNWLSWDHDSRLMYVVGYREGRLYGLYELQLGYADCGIAAAEIQGRFSGISTEQLVDSLDKFFSDPINRQVTVPDALSYIAEQIVGAPASVLQRRLEQIRQHGVSNARPQPETSPHH